MLNAIIFDLDGVIINSEFLTDKANAEFLRAHGKVYDRQEYKPKALGRTLFEGVIIMKELFGISGDPAALAEDRRAHIIKMYREQVTFVPGFLNFYQEVSRRELSRCVATSADPALLAIVREQLSLDRLFPQGIFTIAEVGNRSKPDPAIYLLAAERLATDPACCLVIEDAPNGCPGSEARRHEMCSYNDDTTERIPRGRGLGCQLLLGDRPGRFSVGLLEVVGIRLDE